jgi:hypothetical protein
MMAVTRTAAKTMQVGAWRHCGVRMKICMAHNDCQNNRFLHVFSTTHFPTEKVNKNRQEIETRIEVVKPGPVFDQICSRIKQELKNNRLRIGVTIGCKSDSWLPQMMHDRHQHHFLLSSGISMMECRARMNKGRSPLLVQEAVESTIQPWFFSLAWMYPECISAWGSSSFDCATIRKNTHWQLAVIGNNCR